LNYPIFVGALMGASLFAAPPPESDAARVIYSKSFPGSVPAYVEIVVEKSGAGVYKEDPRDENPVPFELTQSEARQIFDLAQSLDNFARPLESGLKVANMGAKTFRYESGGAAREVKFNYSEDAGAKSLNDIFEQIGETERALIVLERAVKFDKLGAQDAILRIEVLRDQKRLMASRQFLPLLDRVTKNESFLHIARDRAAALAEGIRQSK
jgi:hypothetical protein